MNLIDLFSVGPIYDAIIYNLDIFNIIQLSATCNFFNSTCKPHLTNPKRIHILNAIRPKNRPLPVYFNNRLYYERCPQDFDYSALRYILFLIFTRTNGFINIDTENRIVRLDITIDKIKEINTIITRDYGGIFCLSQIVEDVPFPNALFVESITKNFKMEWFIGKDYISYQSNIVNQKYFEYKFSITETERLFYIRTIVFLHDRGNRHYCILSPPIDTDSVFYWFIKDYLSIYNYHYGNSVHDIRGENILFYKNNTGLRVRISRDKFTDIDYITIRDPEKKYPNCIINLQTRQISIKYD